MSRIVDGVNGLSFGEAFTLTLMTNDPQLALQAERCGVNRIGIDLEANGKLQRQRGYQTRLSHHDYQDLINIRAVISQASVLVRVNALNRDSEMEIERVLAQGADQIMLPFFRTASEVEQFVRLVDSRADVIILLETASSIVRIRDILAVAGIQEVMIGLNDLRLELAVSNHFEVLVSPLVEMIADNVKRAGLQFSIGGVAAPEDKNLRVDPDLVLAQYPRLGATGAWLSRSFVDLRNSPSDFQASVEGIRCRLSEWMGMDSSGTDKAHSSLAMIAGSVGKL